MPPCLVSQTYRRRLEVKLDTAANGSRRSVFKDGPRIAWGDFWSYASHFELLAAHGYVVFKINYHGSTGYGKNFKTQRGHPRQLDFRADMSQSLQLFTTLQMLGMPSKMFCFPDEAQYPSRPQNVQLFCERSTIGLMSGCRTKERYLGINEQHSKSNTKRSLNISPYQNHHCLGRDVPLILTHAGLALSSIMWTCCRCSATSTRSYPPCPGMYSRRAHPRSASIRSDISADKYLLLSMQS